MLRFAKFSMLMALALILLTGGPEAKKKKKKNGGDQGVITTAVAHCDVDPPVLSVRGINLGSQKPSVTLALVPLTVLSEPVSIGGGVTGLQEIVAELPDAFL